MGKTFLYRFFGKGKLPQHMASLLEREEIVLCDEGIGGSVTYRNFRAPGRFYGWRREWFTGSAVLTRARFAAFSFSSPIINIPLDDPRLGELKCSIENESTFCVRFDPAIFHDGWSGTIEYRLSTPQAQRFVELLEEITA